MSDRYFTISTDDKRKFSSKLNVKPSKNLRIAALPNIIGPIQDIVNDLFQTSFHFTDDALTNVQYYLHTIMHSLGEYTELNTLLNFIPNLLSDKLGHKANTHANNFSHSSSRIPVKHIHDHMDGDDEKVSLHITGVLDFICKHFLTVGVEGVKDIEVTGAKLLKNLRKNEVTGLLIKSLDTIEESFGKIFNFSNNNSHHKIFQDL
jgi:hypothetical protein